MDEMPKTTDNYKNVACAKSDENPDRNCDDEPVEPIGDWRLKTEKTLIGSKEIKEVWDAVVWNLKVTAVWWNVENPVITDTLPPVLWYSGYIVTHNPWLMVKKVQYMIKYH